MQHLGSRPFWSYDDHARRDSNPQPSVPKTGVEDSQVPTGESLTVSKENCAAPGAARKSEDTRSPDLEQVVATWHNLPEHIKAAILTLVQGANEAAR